MRPVRAGGEGDSRWAPTTVAAIVLAASVLSSGSASRALADAGVLLVHGTVDNSAMSPILDRFRRDYPDIGVRYRELNSIDLHGRFQRNVRAGAATADVVMSSAIDLQMKLVNDGHALAHRTPHAEALPDWAIWRDEAFAYAFEPVVMVYNAAALAPERRPASRYHLVDLIREYPEALRARIGTYDPAKSGTGYLYFTQDMEQSPIVWELMRALGRARTRLFAASSEIIDRVVTGELLIGYNVVGSYAYERALREPSLRVVAPEDYTLAVSRTVFISRHGRRTYDARVFVDFLLSRAGQRTVSEGAGLFAVRSGSERDAMRRLDSETRGGIRPVRMSPGLLVYVDELKREKVLRRLRASIAPPVPER